MYRYLKQVLSKTISLVTILAFLLTNISYAAPSPRSLSKNTNTLRIPLVNSPDAEPNRQEELQRKAFLGKYGLKRFLTDQEAFAYLRIVETIPSLHTSELMLKQKVVEWIKAGVVSIAEKQDGSKVVCSVPAIKKASAQKPKAVLVKTTATGIKLDSQTIQEQAIERLAAVLEGEDIIYNKKKAAEEIIFDITQRIGMTLEKLQNATFTMDKAFVGRTERYVRYLNITSPDGFSKIYAIKNSTKMNPDSEIAATSLASSLKLAPHFIYSESGKTNKHNNIFIEDKLENEEKLKKEEELLVGRIFAEKLYTMLDISKSSIMYGDNLFEHTFIVRGNGNIDVRFIDWGKFHYVDDNSREYMTERNIKKFIELILNGSLKTSFVHPEVVLASFISRLKEIALQHSTEELDFYNKVLTNMRNHLTGKDYNFSKQYKELYSKADLLIGEIDVRFASFASTGLTPILVQKAMKTFKGWLEKGWTIANHILVAFHVAFIGSVLSLPPDIAGKENILEFMFASAETFVSVGFLWVVWHTAIAVHEMGHYLTAVKVGALNKELLPEAERMLEASLPKRLLWYAKMFCLIPYGKFKGVIKTGLSYHPDAEYNLSQTAAGPRWSRNMAIAFAPLAFTLLAVGLTGGYGLAVYAGRLALGMTAVSTLDYFLADPGEYKKLKERENLAALRAEDARRKTEKAGRWIDLVADVKKRMQKTRPQETRTKNGLLIQAPWQFRNCGMGGRHTEKQYPESNISMQETMFVPLSPKNYEDAQEMTIKLQTRLQEIIEMAPGCRVMGIGLEGGLAPYVTPEEGDIVPEQRLWRMAKQTILDCGYVPGVDVAIALDPACSELENAYREENKDPKAIGMYLFWRDKGKVVMTRDELFKFFSKTIEEGDIPILSIEDGFSEDDDAGWALIKKELGDKLFIIGDDSVTTRDSSIEYAADNDLNNTFLCKANQIGTLSETLLAILVALGKDLDIVVSHRSKSPNDDMEAHIALASFAAGLKTGGGANTERLFKYGAVMQIMARAVREAKSVIEEMSPKEQKEMLELEQSAEELLKNLTITEVLGWEESTNAGIPTVGVSVSFGIKGSEKFKRFFTFKGSTPLGTSAGTGEAIHLVDSVIYANQIPKGEHRVLFEQKSDGSFRFKKNVTQDQIDVFNDTELSELFRRAQRYVGKGCLNAVDYVNSILAEDFVGKKIGSFKGVVDIDRGLLLLEKNLALERGQLKDASTEEENIEIMQRKGNIGMNAILSHSLAMARLLSHLQGKELFEVLREVLEETMAKTIVANGGVDILPDEIRKKVSTSNDKPLWQTLNDQLSFHELALGLQEVDRNKSAGVKLYALLREQLPVYKTELPTTASQQNQATLTEKLKQATIATDL